MGKISIVIADDHRLIRDGIKTLLKKDNDFEIVAEANNGEELIDIINTITPDVILADISMPKFNGIDAMATLKKINPNLKFIILTMHEEPEYIMKSIKAGASSYLLKNVEYEELQKAVRTVAGGGKYFNAFISNIMIENLAQQTEKEEQAPLTPREVEVLKEVANGLSAKLIADKFSISVRTVETHRVNIMKKLNAHNTAEVIKKAIEQKII
jgi:DNA-binding NarL/FixJ family response regulator